MNAENTGCIRSGERFISVTAISVFFIFLYASISGYVFEISDSIHHLEFESVVSSIKQNYNEVMNIAKYIENSETLKEDISIFLSDQSAINDRIKAIDDINNILTGLKSCSKLIKSIHIFCGESQFYTLEYLISHDLSKNLSCEHIDIPCLIYPSSPEQIDRLFTGKHFIEDMTREIYIKTGISNETMFYGNAYILLDSMFFSKTAGGGMNMLMFDNQGIILYDSLMYINNGNRHHDINEYVCALETGKEWILYKRFLENGWTVLRAHESSSFTLKQKPLNMIMLYASAFSFLCSLFLSNYLSGSVLRPVYGIVEFMSGYKYGGKRYTRYVPAASKRKLTLRQKIFYYFILTIMLPVFLFIMLFYFQTIRWERNQISDKYKDNFFKTAEQVEKYFELKSAVFQNILYNLNFQEFVFGAAPGNPDSAAEVLKNYKYLGLGNNELSIFTEKGIFFSNYVHSSDYTDNGAIISANSVEHGVVWDITYDELNNRVFVLLTKIKPVLVTDSGSDMEIYARLRIPFKDISEIFSNLESTAFNVCITDSYGRNIFYDSSEKLFETEVGNVTGKMDLEINQQKYMVFSRKISKTPWYLTSMYNYQDISRQSSSIMKSNIYLTIILLLMIVVLSYFISLLILKPINMFNHMLENYRLSDIDTDMLKDSFINEIDNLGINFNNMIERIEDLFDDLLIANREKNQLMLHTRAAEMVALQAQINPHFLYNTLDNLIQLIDSGYKEKAHQMVYSLSRLFRFGISRGDRIIALSEEIAYAKAYAEIMNIRYGEGIQFTWDIDESLLECRILKLILQPLIENSVLHGFKEMKDNSVIHIRCLREQDNIKLSVSDNGKGISKGKLDEIKKDLHSQDMENKIGIFNVQARIQLQYGKDYGLDIESTKGIGTKVIITIPGDDEEFK